MLRSHHSLERQPKIGNRGKLYHPIEGSDTNRTQEMPIRDLVERGVQRELGPEVNYLGEPAAVRRRNTLAFPF